ncbi:MAG: hypothetical protein WCY54_10410 [Syntrophales bacterium]
MKKMLMTAAVVSVFVAGMAFNAWASYDHMFKNHCDADIQIGFYTHTLLCKDHHSGPIHPGGSWNCSTNCPLGDSVIVDYRGLRYPMTSSPGTGGTHGIKCVKQTDGSYIVTMESE